MREGHKRIELPRAVADLCMASDTLSATSVSGKLQRVARLPVAVGALNAIADSLPDPYHWRFMTVEAFSGLLSQLGGRVADVNALYWRDTMATIEAYTVMAVWRMVDLSKAAFALIESDAIVPAAVLARSALESALQFVHDARTISSCFDEIMKGDLTAAVVTSEELEAFLLQAVFASRQSDADPIYKSKNILTVIEKIAKVAKDDPIAKEYETLCELTHPNFLGRSNYVVGVDPKGRPGDEIRLISHRNGHGAGDVLQSTLWALSWAIEGQAASTHLVQGAMADVASKFPFLATRRH